MVCNAWSGQQAAIPYTNNHLTFKQHVLHSFPATSLNCTVFPPPNWTAHFFRHLTELHSYPATSLNCTVFPPPHWTAQFSRHLTELHSFPAPSLNCTFSQKLARTVFCQLPANCTKNSRHSFPDTFQRHTHTKKTWAIFQPLPGLQIVQKYKQLSRQFSHHLPALQVGQKTAWTGFPPPY